MFEEEFDELEQDMEVSNKVLESLEEDVDPRIVTGGS